MALHDKEAPLAVANFCNLARKGFFDDLPIPHYTRVLRGSGRPNGAFTPTWTFRREFSPKLRFEQAGCLAMFRLGEGTGATTHPTEWFVTIKHQPRWTLDYPIFGTVIAGQPVVDRLQKEDMIVKVEIDGDTKPLFDRHAKEIAQWDEALARSGWAPKHPSLPANTPPTPPTTPGAPRGAPSPPPVSPPSAIR